MAGPCTMLCPQCQLLGKWVGHLSVDVGAKAPTDVCAREHTHVRECSQTETKH